MTEQKKTFVSTRLLFIALKQLRGAFADLLPIILVIAFFQIVVLRQRRVPVLTQSEDLEDAVVVQMEFLLGFVPGDRSVAIEAGKGEQTLDNALRANDGAMADAIANTWRIGKQSLMSLGEDIDPAPFAEPMAVIGLPEEKMPQMLMDVRQNLARLQDLYEDDDLD